MAGRHIKQTSKAPAVIVIAIIAVLVVAAAVIIFLNINNTSAANNNSTTTSTATVQTESTTAVQETQISTSQAVTDVTAEATSAVENSADATQSQLIVLPTSATDGSETYFNASYAPSKAIDTDTGNECTLKEVFGSSYTKGVLTFNEDGTFTDGVSNSSAGTGAYDVVNQTIRATYSNDKNMTVTVTQWDGSVPTEMIINYGGYDVYFN